jgi:hypothetical protein
VRGPRLAPEAIRKRPPGGRPFLRLERETRLELATSTLLIYLALKDIMKKWKRPPKEWHAAKAQLAIQFGDRFTVAA